MKQTAQQTRVPVLRDTLLLLLAGAAGSLDAISYLGLGHVFTANMTGNTVLLGVALAQRDMPAALRNAVALVGFGVGVA
ncbi:MAG: YoaK family protein, partial [Thermomicrobiales bacterium]